MLLLWTWLILKENSSVAESAVVNASPLIFLSRAGLIGLLQLISVEVIVPESVATEIEVRGKRDPTAQALANTLACGYSNTSNPSLGIRTWRIFGSRVGAFPSRFRGHRRRFSSSLMCEGS